MSSTAPADTRAWPDRQTRAEPPPTARRPSSQRRLYRHQMLFLFDERGHGLARRADGELDHVARAELAGQANVRGDDGREFRIAAGRLTIGHEQDGLA